MRLTAWRIVKQKHLHDAFSGEGARRYGGRWNSKGIPIVYTAESRALAAMEMLVHLQASELLQHYLVIPVSFDEALMKRFDAANLPRNWRAEPPPGRLRMLGDAWAAALESVVLQVPSAVVPAESNILLNPLHPDFTKVSTGKPQRFRFDARRAV